MNDIPDKSAFANRIPAHLAEVAEKAGLVDHQQLVRFMEIHETLASGELVDVTEMSDEDFLAILKG